MADKTGDLAKQFGSHDRDWGSASTQIALMTEKLNRLNEHFKLHTKDHHSRRGLMRLVGRRRRLLDYLHRRDASQYRKLIEKLDIRK